MAPPAARTGGTGPQRPHRLAGPHGPAPGIGDAGPHDLPAAAGPRCAGGPAMKRFGFHESPVLASRPAFWRARLVVIVLMLGFTALGAKALNVQILSNEFLQRQGERRYERTLVLQASRGKILDRSGSVVLASSMPARAIWTIPEDFHKASEKQVAELARLLDTKPAELRRLTRDEDKNFVYLQRQVAMDKAKAIQQLKIPGVHQLAETRRFYPEGEVMAHIVGFTNIEDRGIE